MKHVIRVTFNLKHKCKLVNLPKSKSYMVDTSDLKVAKFKAEGAFLTWLFSEGEKYNVTHPHEMVKYYEDEPVTLIENVLTVESTL